MKIVLELDEGIYQAIKRMMPGIDLEIALSGILREIVITIATHPAEFEQAFKWGSIEARRKLDEQLQKAFPKVIEKARFIEQPAVYECDCNQQFTIPQEDFEKVRCPSCGREWTVEELAKLRIK